MEPKTYAAQPPTPMMAGVGFSFSNVLDYARHTVHLLQTTGDTFLDMAYQGWVLWQAFAAKDYGKIISALSAERRDVEAAIAAIKEEFGI